MCSDHLFSFRTKSNIVVHYAISYIRNVTLLLIWKSLIVSHLLSFGGSGFDFTTSRPVFFFFRSPKIKYQYIKTVDDLLYKRLVTTYALFTDLVKTNSSERNPS
jgi:hypothetical protein